MVTLHLWLLSIASLMWLTIVPNVQCVITFGGSALQNERNRRNPGATLVVLGL